MLNFWVFFCSFFCLMGAFTALGTVVLIGSNVTVSFEDTEANFAPLVKGSGKCGTLYVAEPLDACSPLTNKIVSKLNHTMSPFVLIIRGGCSFEEKVRRAQAAGFKAAIVYDSENGDLIAMAGHSAGIKTLAVFVSKVSGETLKKYAGAADVELWIVPSFENSAWSIMGISFISLLAMCAVVVSCFFVRRNRIRRGRPQTPRVRDFHGMSSRLVKAMPSLIFTTVLDDNCTSRTCTICLEDYNVGEKLRILPCRHKFHALCVDTWLTSWRTFCPVCKRDARTTTSDPPSSESTPLLSSTPDSVSSSLLSSFRSSMGSSSAIQTHSISSSPNNQQSLQSHNQSPHPMANQGIIDLKNTSSQRSPNTSLVPPHSSLSHLNSRQISSWIPTQCHASSHIGSSSHQPNPLQYSESAENYLPFATTLPLSEC